MERLLKVMELQEIIKLVQKIEMAGKTGTVQVVRISEAEEKKV